MLILFVMTPPLVGAALRPAQAGGGDTVQTVTWLMCDLLVLSSAAVLYCCWRIRERPTTAWLSVALTVLALNGTTDALSRLAAGRSPAFHDGYLAIVVALPIVAAVMLAAWQCPLPRSVNPLVLGLLVSIAFGSLRFARPSDGVPTLVDTPRSGEVLLTVLFTLGGVLACLAIARLDTVPSWVRRAATVATAAECTAQIFSTWAEEDRRLELVALVATVVAAVQIGSASIALLVETIMGTSHRIAALPARIEDAVQHTAAHQDVMHELRSTVAGITTAAELLRRHDDRVAAVRRVCLEQMLESELARLGRLLEDGPAHQPTGTDLDSLISPLVVGQRAAGHEVLWQPSGLEAVCRPDDLSEAVHILLTNAARHARGAVATVSAVGGADGVQIRVCDGGPGVAPAIAPYLFDRGSRSERSPGEGIGLHIAQRLLRDQGGSLCLESSSPQSGSTFLISVPATHSHPPQDALGR